MAAIASACLIVFNNLGTSENAKAEAVSQAEVTGGGVDDETIINLPTRSISITGDSISSSVAKFLSNRVINCARERILRRLYAMKMHPTSALAPTKRSMIRTSFS